MPIFTIIIPTFNSANTLGTALASVINQSFKNFEVLIMDGLSTDNTTSIAQSFKDFRIKIFSEKDKGIYDAMNKGIDKAKGEWLYFLGSDDEFANSLILEKINAYLKEKSKMDFLYGNVFWGYSNSIYDGKFGLIKLFEPKNICHQAIFIRSATLISLGKFNLKYPVLADHDLNIKVFMSKTYNIKYVDDVIAKYSTEGISTQLYSHDPFYTDLKLIKTKFLNNLSLLDKFLYWGETQKIKNGKSYKLKASFYKIIIHFLEILNFKIVINF